MVSSAASTPRPADPAPTNRAAVMTPGFSSPPNTGKGGHDGASAMQRPGSPARDKKRGLGGTKRQLLSLFSPPSTSANPEIPAAAAAVSAVNAAADGPTSADPSPPECAAAACYATLTTKYPSTISLFVPGAISAASGHTVTVQGSPLDQARARAVSAGRTTPPAGGIIARPQPAEKLGYLPSFFRGGSSRRLPLSSPTKKVGVTTVVGVSPGKKDSWPRRVASAFTHLLRRPAEPSAMAKNSQEIEEETWIRSICKNLESGEAAERCTACDMLQAVLKGVEADACRQALAGNRAIPQLLMLGQHKETAKAAMYALQLLAATPRPLDPAKLWMEECGCIDTLVHITIVAVNSFIRGQVGGSAFMAEEWPSASAEEAADVSQTISHMLATLVNLCIGAPDRKDKCLQSPQFVTLLADLLRLDEHRDVQKTTAYLVATMAIGSEARKQILATDRVIFALAALLKSEVPASVQFQVVVAIRAVMHNSLDRQIRLAQQPGIMDDLKALLPPPTFFIPQSMGSLFSSKAMINRGTEKDQMEVMIAISVLRAARANMEKAAQADDECSTPDEDTFTDAGSSFGGGRRQSQVLFDSPIELLNGARTIAETLAANAIAAAVIAAATQQALPGGPIR